MKLPERIYAILKLKKMKQSSVAVAAGYTTRAFNDMLRNRKRITADDIIKICNGLEVTPNELFGIGDSEQSA